MLYTTGMLCTPGMYANTTNTTLRAHTTNTTHPANATLCAGDVLSPVESLLRRVRAVEPLVN
jgi:hypothetical protein